MKQSLIATSMRSTEFWMAMLFIAGTFFFFTREPWVKPIDMPSDLPISATPTPVPLVKTPRQEIVSQPRGVMIRVKSGDTFWKIAQKHCGSHRYAESIAAQNGYGNARTLREGAVLHLTCVLK